MEKPWIRFDHLWKAVAYRLARLPISDGGYVWAVTCCVESSTVWIFQHEVGGPKWLRCFSGKCWAAGKTCRQPETPSSPPPNRDIPWQVAFRSALLSVSPAAASLPNRLFPPTKSILDNHRHALENHQSLGRAQIDHLSDANEG